MDVNDKGASIMRYSISGVMLFLVVIALSSCITQRASVQGVPGYAACKMSCQERFERCRQVCDKSCQKCSETAHCSAARHYNRMVHEQVIQGGIVSRELNSYRDPLQCRKTTCNCQADYTVCKAGCTGIIRKRLQVGPACC